MALFPETGSGLWGEVLGISGHTYMIFTYTHTSIRCSKSLRCWRWDSVKEPATVVGNVVWNNITWNALSQFQILHPSCLIPSLIASFTICLSSCPSLPTPILTRTSPSRTRHKQLTAISAQTSTIGEGIGSVSEEPTSIQFNPAQLAHPLE